MKKEIKNIDTPGFKIPSNYFNSIEDNVMGELDVSRNISKKSPFLTPQSYFETFETKILEKVSIENKEPKVISLFNNTLFNYVAGIAAIGILLFSVLNFPGNGTLDFSSIENSQISYYLEQGYISISDFELESLISEQALNNNTLLTSDISNEELFEYLANESEVTSYLFED